MAERFEDRVDVVDQAGREVFQFDARFAVLDLGAAGNEGDLRIRGDDGEFTFHLDGGRQLFVVRDAAGRDVLKFDGEFALLEIGAQGKEGDLFIRDNAGRISIRMDGNSGDIVLSNADCAEDFDASSADPVEPGSVVVLDDIGSVRMATRAYDRRVAGIVAGAGDRRPGIVLGRHAGSTGRLPVAVAGTTYCKVDASSARVEVGDLLTSSDNAGHAMRAADPLRAAGAVIGKAMRPLDRGTGLVPVLVALA
jgi:hypothetical protein